MNIFKKILIGILTGIVSGLFGTGGGLILVPCFMYVLKLEPLKARATTIMCIIPMTIISGFIYNKNNYMNFNTGILCAIGGIIGGIVGSNLLKKIPDYILRIIFIVFLSYFSFNMILR